jgi:hypothetical protein
MALLGGNTTMATLAHKKRSLEECGGFVVFRAHTLVAFHVNFGSSDELYAFMTQPSR